MKGSIRRYCFCKDPVTGRELGGRCPELASSRHGEWESRDRLHTSIGYRGFRRRGFRTKAEAETFRSDVYQLLGLAQGDQTTLAKLGDLIFDKTRRGGQLPSIDDVRRRLGLGQALDRSQTYGEFAEQWFAGKRSWRASTARSARQHLDHYLIPQLGDVPLDRLNAAHIAALLDRIDSWNAEISAAQAAERKPVLEGDIRTRAKLVGSATQRRIFATLRTSLNAAVKQRQITYNATAGVDVEPEHRDPARIWSPEQVRAFLNATEDERLGLLYRIVLTRGLRRGEVVGIRWRDVDLDAKELHVRRPILQLGGKLVESRPKTRAGERTVSLTADLVIRLRAHRKRQLAERLACGEAYDDRGLIFAREDGSAVPPDYVTRHFRELADKIGLPRIKLHEGRHTAASLALEAGLDVKIVSDQLGHATTRITHDLYQHVRRAVHEDAAEKVEELLAARKASEETGS
jgi:integrase